jgi:hypothetical protein
MPLGWNDRHHLPRLAVLANLIAVIPFVHDYILQLGHGRAVVNDRLKDRCIMAGAARQLQGSAGLFVETAGMECDGKPAPRAAQRLCGMLMGSHHRPLNTEVLGHMTAILVQALPKLPPNAPAFPTAEAVVHRIPMAKLPRQISPGGRRCGRQRGPVR